MDRREQQDEEAILGESPDFQQHSSSVTEPETVAKGVNENRRRLVSTRKRKRVDYYHDSFKKLKPSL